MKKTSTVLLLLLLYFASAAQVWTNNKDHSRLSFTVRHLMISDITGTFNDFDVTITSSKANFSDAVFELKARTNSIDTKVPDRDNDLRSANFFDAQRYPEIHFKSTGITKINKNTYTITGMLTMHGITKEVSADFTFMGITVNPATKKTTVGIKLTAILKRTDFKIGWNTPGEIIKNDVLIVADGEFEKK